MTARPRGRLGPLAFIALATIPALIIGAVIWWATGFVEPANADLNQNQNSSTRG